MIRSGFSYLKLTAVVAVWATTLIGLSGLLSVATMAQEKAPPREIDLRAKLKDRKFPDGRRVEIHALDAGEKIVAEIKGGKFINWFLVAADGAEAQGVVKKKTVTSTTVATCAVTITTTTTTTKRGKTTSVSTSTVIQIPCPDLTAGT